VFLVALVVRMLFAGYVAIWHPARFTGTIAREGTEIGHIAVNLFEGRDFSSPFDLGSQRTAWVCPAMPALWSLILLVVGADSPTAMMLLWFMQALASSLAAALYVVILRRVASERTLPNVLTMWGIVVALWPESILRITELWYYVWQELGVAVLVLCGIAWASRPTLRHACLLGAAGGGIALLNVTPIPIFLTALLVPLAGRPRHGIRRVVAALAIAGAIVTPWLIRDAMVFDHFIPLRGNGGFELWQGNNPRAAIRQRADSRHPGIQADELRAYQALGEYEYSRLAGERAVEWIGEHPGLFAWHAVQRVYVTWLTDIFEHWSWDGRPWWAEQPLSAWTLLRQTFSTLTAIVTLALAGWALWRNGLRSVPYPYLLLGVPILMPLPHYFTQIDPSYVAFLRVWLALIALTSWLSRKAKSPEVAA
jgi:hypothetical protein